jgi:hypothetical protein
MANEGVERTFYFLEGNLVHACSNLPLERLESMVVAEGILSREYLDMVSHYRLEKQTLSSVLRVMHLISHYEFKKQVEKLARCIFVSALQWESCALTFEERNFELETDETTDIPLSTLLVAAARELKELEDVVASLRSLKGRVSLNASKVCLLDDAELNADEGYIISRVRGESTLPEIVAITGLDENRAYRSLFAFLVIGVLELDDVKDFMDVFRKRNDKSSDSAEKTDGEKKPDDGRNLREVQELKRPTPDTRRIQTASFSYRVSGGARGISCGDLISKFLHETRRLS